MIDRELKGLRIRVRRARGKGGRTSFWVIICPQCGTAGEKARLSKIQACRFADVHGQKVHRGNAHISVR